MKEDANRVLLSENFLVTKPTPTPCTICNNDHGYLERLTHATPKRRSVNEIQTSVWQMLNTLHPKCRATFSYGHIETFVVAVNAWKGERGPSSISQTGTVSKAMVGKLLRDGVERVWAFPSAWIPSVTELLMPLFNALFVFLTEITGYVIIKSPKAVILFL